MSELFPAATVVLLRDGEHGLEVLLLRRAKEIKFAGNSWVFPGGRIDAGDYSAGSDNVLAAARKAAVRETMEEAGVKIAEQGLHFFSHWSTPANFPKRFATWFFVAEYHNDEKIVVDGGEIEEHRWVTPAQALTDFADKHIDIMPPAFVTLTELSEHASAAAALSFYKDRGKPLTILPKLIKQEEGACMLYQGDAGYDDGDVSIVGGRHRLWVLKSGWRYEKSER